MVHWEPRVSPASRRAALMRPPLTHRLRRHKRVCPAAAASNDYASPVGAFCRRLRKPGLDLRECAKGRATRWLCRPLISLLPPPLLFRGGLNISLNRPFVKRDPCSQYQTRRGELREGCYTDQTRGLLDLSRPCPPPAAPPINRLDNTSLATNGKMRTSGSKQRQS